MSTFADQATKLVLGDRNSTYGSPADDYAKTAKIWSGLLLPILKREIRPEEAMLMMVGLKLSREVHLHKPDNIIDAHGYLLCYEWAANGKRPTPETDELVRAVEDVACGTAMQCGKCGKRMPCMCEHQ